MRTVVMLLFALSLSAVAAPVPRSLKAKPYVGDWTIEFTNGVVERCQVGRDDTAALTEPLRTAGGRAERKPDGVVVIAFDDDRTERWTPNGDGFAVEHWCPSAAYPTATPVRGTASRTPTRR